VEKSELCAVHHTIDTVTNQQHYLQPKTIHNYSSTSCLSEFDVMDVFLFGHWGDALLHVQ